MADETVPAALPPEGPDAGPPPPPPPPPASASGFVWRWTRRIGAVLAVLAMALLGALLVLDSPIGHRFVADRISTLAPASGLRITVGRIDGSLFGKAGLKDLVLSDPNGPFLTVPDVDLDWRPYAWTVNTLDIRTLALHRGTLLRRPQLKPGDPNAPILPSFNIRVDRLEIDALTIAPGVMGERRRVDLTARADVRSGRTLIDANGRLGGKDRLALHLDSEPDRDKFDLALDYAAPRGGLLSALTGVKSDIVAKVAGKGRFRAWHGWAVARRDGERLAGFLIDNRAGTYTVAGQVFPEALLAGAARRIVGNKLSLFYQGTFADSRLDGRYYMGGAAFRATGQGAVDLTDNRVDQLALKADLRRPDLVMASPELAGVRLAATLDGPLRDLAIRHDFTIDRLKSGTTQAEGLHTAGIANWNGKRLLLPLAVTAKKVVTGNGMIDPRFVGASVKGDLVVQGSQLSSEQLAIDLKGLAARLVLRSDMAKGMYALAGPVTARGFALPNLGLVDADAKIVFGMGNGVPWSLRANAAGRMARIDNGTLANLTGGNIRFSGGVVTGALIPLRFSDARLSSRKLAIALNGQVHPDGRTTVVGKGRHLDYGDFTIDAAVAKDGPSAVLVFANPLPAAGLKDVRVALSPVADGFRIETKGDSTLGPFDGVLGLQSPPKGPTRIAIEHFKVWQTEITGGLDLATAGVSGDLAITGGGIDGTVRLDPKEGGQAITALVTARNARFGGARPISIGNGKVEVNGFLAEGKSTIDATAHIEGIGAGQLFIGRLAINAKLVNGAGSVTASIAGRRGTRFAMQGTASIAPDKIVALASGDYSGRAIQMPRRAVLEREGEGWRLQPTQVNFGRGAVIAEGHVLGGPTELKLQIARMPLSLADIVVADLGLGGALSGVIDYRNDHTGAPSGHAAVQVRGLTRSGLVLTSRPMNLSLVADLDPSALQARAVFKDGGRDGGTVRGGVQALLSGLPRGGTVLERLRGGRLQAQVRYGGPAETLWRLAAVDFMDLTGTIGARADITGTLDDPTFVGAIASKDLSVQSSVIGTDIQNIQASGTFNDSRLSLNRFAGTTANGGKVTGSGTIDLSNIVSRGVALDLRMAAQNARIVNRDDMAATVTGPLRIVSDGIGGTIAGRVRIEQARWALGSASAVAELPSIPTREINPRADVAPARTPSTPWTFLIDASGANRIDVRGLGLDSEWGADIRLRGTTANPQIFGSADLVRGGYEFAGKRFDLTRGRIRFAGEVPIDPRLDIAASGDANGVSATITITGSGMKPVIAFSSTPSLPEEELLSRLLFGSSITQISAPEAVQLAAALASLRGGGGLDPINKLRSAIGLDRLRILNADASIPRGTSVAAGKYLGRKFFVELVTDGRGYNATSVEFRITRWLALLASVATIGDESLNLRVSKDY
jgi:translocation and assembly module TamB